MTTQMSSNNYEPAGQLGAALYVQGIKIFAGSGAPSFSAPIGSLYSRTDGSSTSTRLYVNTDGGATWTNVVTAA